MLLWSRRFAKTNKGHGEGLSAQSPLEFVFIPLIIVTSTLLTYCNSVVSSVSIP